MDPVRPDTPVAAPPVDPADAAAERERLAALAQLVGGLAAEVRDEAASRLPVVARDAFARLAGLLGAQRVVWWRAEPDDGRLAVAHDWAGPSPAPAEPPVASAEPPLVSASYLGAPPAGPSPAAPPPLPPLPPPALPWTAAQLVGADPRTALAAVPGEAGGVTVPAGAGAVVAVPLVAQRTLDAVLSVHWRGKAAGWSPTLAPLLRTLVSLLRGAERLAELAERPALDEVTGLANRKLLLVALGRSLAQLERRATSGVAVLACQVTAPSDAGPHGDLVRRVGRRLDRQTREGDLVGVFDSHTLVVVCDGVPGPEDALAIAHRLSRAGGEGRRANPLHDPGGDDVPAAVRISFGVAHVVQRVPPGVVLRQADAAAYLAATSGDSVRLAQA